MVDVLERDAMAHQLGKTVRPLLGSDPNGGAEIEPWRAKARMTIR